MCFCSSRSACFCIFAIEVALVHGKKLSCSYPRVLHQSVLTCRLLLLLDSPILLQLETMSRTDILITPCGGIGIVLLFLQPGATAIVMN